MPRQIIRKISSFLMSFACRKIGEVGLEILVTASLAPCRHSNRSVTQLFIQELNRLCLRDTIQRSCEQSNNNNNSTPTNFIIERN